ncbi:MAG TPA: hypothetical protein VF258_05390, partial [Luteolibacter sp.]
MHSKSILRAAFQAALALGLAPTLPADTDTAHSTVVITVPHNTGTFGKFTYTYTDTSITIIDYPETEVGAVTIPTTIDVEVLGLATIPNTLGGMGGDVILGQPTIKTLPVTTIGGSAFSNCNGLTSITIPDSV